MRPDAPGLDGRLLLAVTRELLSLPVAEERRIEGHHALPGQSIVAQQGVQQHLIDGREDRHGKGQAHTPLPHARDPIPTMRSRPAGEEAASGAGSGAGGRFRAHGKVPRCAGRPEGTSVLE